MPRFKRLTRDDLNQLTRGQLLDRVEAEQQYWFRKLDREGETPENHAAYEEFRTIMHAAVDPAEAVADALRLVEAGPAAARYWDEIPGGEAHTAVPRDVAVRRRPDAPDPEAVADQLMAEYAKRGGDGERTD